MRSLTSSNFDVYRFARSLILCNVEFVICSSIESYSSQCLSSNILAVERYLHSILSLRILYSLPLSTTLYSWHLLIRSSGNNQPVLRNGTWPFRLRSVLMFSYNKPTYHEDLPQNRNLPGRSDGGSAAGVQHVYRNGTPNGSEGGPFLMEGKKRTVGVVGARAAMM